MEGARPEKEPWDGASELEPPLEEAVMQEIVQGGIFAECLQDAVMEIMLCEHRPGNLPLMPGRCPLLFL